MKPIALWFALALLSALPVAAATVEVHVANGDCVGFQHALNLGAQSNAELIVLAKNGSYPNCSVTTPQGAGATTIDANGSTLVFGPPAGLLYTQSPVLAVSAHPFTIRNATIQIGDRAVVGARHGAVLGPAFQNNGDMILESSTILIAGDSGIGNGSNLVLRNVTVTNASGYSDGTFIGTVNTSPNSNNIPGTVDIEQSTLANQGTPIFSGGNITISNSILVANSQSSGQGLCAAPYSPFSPPVSLGGNIFSDNSCGYNAATDHIVTDAGLADFGTHGGVVGTLALNFNSPARYAGLAANCTANDARGVARGSAHCDAGAYEFGGGYGQLGASGMSGAYYDAAHDGHYVTVQNLDNGNAVVIWNTFNQQGRPAWVYGVGTVNGRTIHVANVSQNLDGVLQPGGNVIGSKETAWGSFDFTISDCLTATLSYNSTNPLFGSGSVSFTRIAFVSGLDCSN